MTEATTEQNQANLLTTLWKDTRVPDPATLGKLPRATCRDCSQSASKVCGKHAKSKCDVCGNYMTGAHIHLDYQGHADVTDILLAHDPCWTWEPMAYTEAGEPVVTVRDKTARMWIRLTVHGMTRPAVGTCPAGKEDVEKELIGDALRNGAMRFGIGVTLWSKAEGMHVSDETPPAPPAEWFTKATARYEALPEDVRVKVLDRARKAAQDDTLDIAGMTHEDWRPWFDTNLTAAEEAVAKRTNGGTPPTSDETPPTSTESAPKDAATAEPPKAPPAPPAPAEQATEGEQAELAEAIAIHEANLANPQRQVYRAWGRAQGLPFAQSGGIDTAKITLEQARAVEAHLTEMLTAKAS